MSAAARIEIVLLVAVADNGVIGRNNGLPWRLSSDLKRFKALTMGKPVLMGRKTFQSIGKPLAGRTNIVLTRDPAFTAAGGVVARDLASALDAARGDAMRRGVAEIFVIGGTDVFRETMPFAHRLEVTEVRLTPEGDAFMPPIDPNVWQAAARADQAPGPQDEAPFTYVTYFRR